MSTKGHNSGPVSADRLKSFVERIEQLCEERDGIQSDIRDVYSEAKGVGYDVKTMRKVVSLRKMDESDRVEQEALLDTYWHALTTIDRLETRIAAGEPVTKAAAAEGVSRATGYRVSQKRAQKSAVENETVADGVIEDAAPREDAHAVIEPPQPEGEGRVSSAGTHLKPAENGHIGERSGPERTPACVSLAAEMPDMPEFLRRETVRA